MSIKPVCDRCKKELNDFGAILFSPPSGKDVKKFHICKDCYSKIKKTFLNSPKARVGFQDDPKSKGFMDIKTEWKLNENGI